MNQSINDERERISALADGQLRGDEFGRTIEAIVRDPGAQAVWRDYHMVGEVLRSGSAAASRADVGFAARFAARLAQEAPHQRPQIDRVATENVAEEDYSTRAIGRKDTQEAANNPIFRWKAVAGFATVVALGAVGWNLLGTPQSPESAPQLALQPAAPASLALASPVGQPATPAAEPQRMIRDARLDELLAAHEQSGGVSVLQMPAGFLRNATFDGRGR